ncbi:hypothetical protein BU23DRAFT_559897 [Bimuria novae-zelandiae CBS 107.79]|uniref:Uncharacterized protein n=1 Tax=Bimuria novae-zelandiae CBS 107.79 TaxID=1447943 RepID=A0A6A5UVD9_9PLEO|nr:hypothetical protein BU23DRAFT_559897 [Bimuria novae-zelandiae CBS 107.79]
MAISPPNTTLSANDARILSALFDPETLPSSVASSKTTSTIDASLPSHPTISSQLSTLEAQQNELVRKISSSSSETDIEAAIRQEDEIIANYAEYPSAYLNRAMLGRMKLETSLSDQQSIFSRSEVLIDALFSDLARAISTCLPSSSSSVSVSPYQARILRTAYSHRAYLYLKAAEMGVAWNSMGKGELEERASADFSAAARFGDEVAREMSVRTNPYAKMCGAIVRNALREEREEMLG